MTVHEILLRQTWSDVKQAFLKLYPHHPGNIKHRKGYSRVFKKVQTLKPIIKEAELVIKDVSSEENPNYFDVYELEKTADGTLQDYSLMGGGWAEIMGITVSESLVQQFGEPAIVAHCLYEMTWCGFTEEKIRRYALISRKELLRSRIKLHDKHIYSGKRFSKE